MGDYRYLFLAQQMANFAGVHIVPHLKFAGAPFKTPEWSEAKSAPQAKIFHFSKVICELLWSFFPKYANKTTLMQYNFIHIISQRA